MPLSEEEQLKLFELAYTPTCILFRVGRKLGLYSDFRGVYYFLERAIEQHTFPKI